MQTAPDNILHTKLAFQRWGQSGPRVLLVHAIGLDRHSWERIVPPLKRDYQIVAVDLPGHGESDKPLAVDYGLWSMGERLEGFLDELGWDDAILVGNSIGGGVSLSLALQAPKRVKALALINSVAFRSGLPLVGRLAFLPLVPHLPIATPLTPDLAFRVGLESARRGWGSVTAERCTATRTYLGSPDGRAAFFRSLRQLYGPDLDQMSARYGEIRCPTLVLHGDRDPLIRFSHAARLANAIPNAELQHIPSCGHFPQEERPDETLYYLRRFLSSVQREGIS